MRVLALCAVLATPAQAHPHVFIDAGLRFLVDETGQLGAVEITWAYDPLYSLLFLTGEGVIPETDNTLDQAVLDDLSAKIMPQTTDGVVGDFTLSSGEQVLALSEPLNVQLRYEEGRLINLHTRALLDRTAQPVQAKMYDPSYYVAYEITLPVTVSGPEGCAVSRVPADLITAYDTVEELLYGPSGAGLTEDDFPAVGGLFAEVLNVTCSSS